MASYENKKITLKDAAAAATAVEQEYRRRGYLTTLAYLPPQKIADGRLLIEITEGKMGVLHIEGNHYFSESRIRRRWKIPSGALLRGQDILRSLRGLNENPDRQARIVLRPGAERGLTDVYLKITDRAPYHFGAAVDNYGNRATGLYRPSFSFRHTDFIIPDSTLYTGFLFRSISEFFSTSS